MDATRNTLTLTDSEREHLRHALAETMRRDCEAASEDLREHCGGSAVALEDARSAVRRASEVAGMLGRLEAG